MVATKQQKRPAISLGDPQGVQQQTTPTYSCEREVKTAEEGSLGGKG